jgi:hypothetical protein
MPVKRTLWSVSPRNPTFAAATARLPLTSGIGNFTAGSGPIACTMDGAFLYGEKAV